MTQQDDAARIPQQALFRPEVSACHSQQNLGAIRLAQAISGWLIAALIAALLIAFITLL